MSELWDEACRLYAAPGVRACCLELQDAHGIDVPLLLALLVLDGAGVRLDADRVGGLAAACGAWQREVVAPLRAARRALRPDSAPAARLELIGADQTQLKARVQDVELAAERLQLDALAVLASGWARGEAAPAPALVLRRLGAPLPAERWAALLEACARQLTNRSDAAAISAGVRASS